jgi:hypothetical protein
VDESRKEDDGSERDESTDGYPDDSLGYFAHLERPKPTGPPPPPPEPAWKRHGFESQEAWIKYLRAQQNLGSPLPKGTPVPTTELPGDEVGEIGAPPAVETRSRQINVKLRVEEGEKLDKAAWIYGLAPSTLARLLVNRGVRAILDRET